MSKKLLSFLLSELKTVRIICKQCEGISELSIKMMGTRLVQSVCPLCRRDLLPGSKEDLFLQLSNIILAVNANDKMVDVEFIIPDDEKADKDS